MKFGVEEYSPECEREIFLCVCLYEFWGPCVTFSCPSEKREKKKKTTKKTPRETEKRKTSKVGHASIHRKGKRVPFESKSHARAFSE